MKTKQSTIKVPAQVIAYVEEEARKESYLRAFFAGATTEGYDEWCQTQIKDAAVEMLARQDKLNRWR